MIRYRTNKVLWRWIEPGQGRLWRESADMRDPKSLPQNGGLRMSARGQIAHGSCILHRKTYWAVISVPNCPDVANLPVNSYGTGDVQTVSMYHNVKLTAQVEQMQGFRVWFFGTLTANSTYKVQGNCSHCVECFNELLEFVTWKKKNSWNLSVCKSNNVCQK